MSLKYLLQEGFVKMWNKIGKDAYRTRYYESLAHPEPVDEIPSYLYKKFSVQKENFDGFQYFKISPNEGKSGTAVFYIAGGGGLAGPTERHFRTVERLLETGVCDVCLPFYPLAPEHNVRFALRWLQKVYANLLKDFKSDRIALAGDGIGANMALSLFSRVAHKPGKIVLISPKVGLGLEKNRELMQRAGESDIFETLASNDLIVKSWAGNAAMDSPDFEPSSIDFTGFPPIQLFYGTKEIYYPMVGSLIARIESTETPLEIHYKNMCHSWPLHQDLSEGRAAVKQIAEFISGS